MYRVQLSSEAEEFYAVANRPLAKKLVRCFEQLEQNPRLHPNIKSLKGNFTGYYRYRVGDHRVIYYVAEESKGEVDNEGNNEVDNVNSLVIVTIIAHRREVYE